MKRVKIHVFCEPLAADTVYAYEVTTLGDKSVLVASSRTYPYTTSAALAAVHAVMFAGHPKCDIYGAEIEVHDTAARAISIHVSVRSSASASGYTYRITVSGEDTRLAEPTKAYRTSNGALHGALNAAMRAASPKWDVAIIELEC